MNVGALISVVLRRFGLEGLIVIVVLVALRTFFDCLLD